MVIDVIISRKTNALTSLFQENSIRLQQRDEDLVKQGLHFYILVTQNHMVSIGMQHYQKKNEIAKLSFLLHVLKGQTPEPSKDFHFSTISTYVSLLRSLQTLPIDPPSHYQDIVDAKP